MNVLVVANNLDNTLSRETVEAPRANDRMTRHERRTKRRAERSMRLRETMKHAISQLEEFTEKYLHVEFQSFASQSSMRVNSIGIRSSNNGHGGR
jgi:chemotaxis regulatin CheY-phosphate phosphatase CheZ